MNILEFLKSKTVFGESLEYDDSSGMFTAKNARQLKPWWFVDFSKSIPEFRFSNSQVITFRVSWGRYTDWFAIETSTGNIRVAVDPRKTKELCLALSKNGQEIRTSIFKEYVIPLFLLLAVLSVIVLISVYGKQWLGD